MFGLRDLAAPMLALALALAGPPAARADHQERRASDEVRTQLTLRGTGINGSSQRLSGMTTIRTPAAWRHLTRDGSRSQRFETSDAGPCTARIHISPRAVATRATAQQQVDRAMRFRVGPLLGSGTLPRGGAWALDVHVDGTGDPDAPAPEIERTLYGIAVERIATRRYVHTRAWVELGSGCSEEEVRRGAVQRAVARLLRTAVVRARIS